MIVGVVADVGILTRSACIAVPWCNLQTAEPGLVACQNQNFETNGILFGFSELLSVFIIYSS